MQNVTQNITNDMGKSIFNNILTKTFLKDIFQQIIAYILQLQDTILSNKLYLSIVLVGSLLILSGLYVSIYKKSFSKNKRQLRVVNIVRYIKYIELITNRFPFRVLSKKLSEAMSYFMLETVIQRGIVALLSLLLPCSGIILYLMISGGLNLWYTRVITASLCIMLPYYIFTLVVDYMKYSIRLKIPLLIDSFRSSFMMHYRVKPALQECGKRTNKALGRIILSASDSSDLNQSLCAIRDRVNDTWFNIFVMLILNYRENGGELIAQLYKLSRSITRYNNIEKKKNKRLIWYEVFVILTSIFSLPSIILLNKMILGFSAWSYYDTTAAFTKVMIFSVMALLIVRTLRRM